VSHIVEGLARHFGVARPWTQDPGTHPREELALSLNSQKANYELRWTPRLPLDEALTWIAAWYRRLAAGESARALCEEQIDAYTKRWA
jgi:CDP-glucose 4,6-dehydratase